MKISKVILLVGVLFFFSCKKEKDRTCFKSYGDVIEVEVPIDSVQKFELFKGIVYRFYQDTLRKVVIKGGENVVGLVDVKVKDYMVSVHNGNSCNFLRDYEDKITVEIHYPHYSSIYAEPTEPMRFMDTLKGGNVKIELRNGGESLDLVANLNRLDIEVTYGTGIINAYGSVNFLKLLAQNYGRINALGVSSNDMFIFHNSSGDILANFTNSNVKSHILGNGDVRYIGVSNSLEITKSGVGEIITY